MMVFDSRWDSECFEPSKGRGKHQNDCSCRPQGGVAEPSRRNFRCIALTSLLKYVHNLLRPIAFRAVAAGIFPISPRAMIAIHNHEPHKTYMFVLSQRTQSCT